MKRYHISAIALIVVMLTALTLLTTMAYERPAEPGRSGGTILDIAYAQDAWGGGRFDGPVQFVLPTVQATATPGITINGYGLGVLLDVQDSGASVFRINNGGTVDGKVLRYATAGSQIVCGVQVITDSASITTGLSQSTYCIADLNVAPSGDARTADCQPGTTSVTVRVRNSALTPAANSTGAAVTWCAIGTP